MNRKQILVKTAQYAKKHKMSVNTIVVLFAVIILSCYLKDLLSRILRKIFKPLTVSLHCMEKLVSKGLNEVAFFCRRHRKGIIKLECGMLAAGILMLIIVKEGALESAWGDENTGVFAQEPSESNDVEEEENTKDAEIKEPESEYNNIENESIPSASNIHMYYIRLNRVMNTVTIYTYDRQGEYTVPVKAMRCATGGEDTPLGIYELSHKYEFAELLYNSYGQYCTRINGPILFHSSTYTELKKDTLSAEDYNLLGESVSHGCVRLTTADAKWIYDNCDAGTVVEIYDEEGNPGPLGKPETIKVPEGTLWDPTDPDVNNPWNSSKPVINGAVNRIVYEHEKYNDLDGITATDTCGNDITDKIIVESNVNTDIPGTYDVTYRVTDAIGKSAEVTVQIILY